MSQKASVYRLLKAHDLITNPAFVVIKAANEFRYKTTAPNQIWQTDFTCFKVIGWGGIGFCRARTLRRPWKNASRAAYRTQAPFIRSPSPTNNTKPCGFFRESDVEHRKNTSLRCSSLAIVYFEDGNALKTLIFKGLEDVRLDHSNLGATRATL